MMLPGGSNGRRVLAIAAQIDVVLMKSIQIGSAVTAPVSPLPIGFFSS